MAVAIVGMHRSGTSMVTHALKLGGLYLGDEADLLAPGPENPDGYWENAQLVDVNDEVLSALGGGWEALPGGPSDWAADDRLGDVRGRAASILDRISRDGPWGWKDPRTTVTLPFWRELADPLKIVLCIRNPLEVALSLQRRGMFSYENALRLW